MALVFAESKRFELLVPRGTLVFKTSAFDHSANSLCLGFPTHFVQMECKYRGYFYNVKLLRDKF